MRRGIGIRSACLASVAALACASGCVATRNWVRAEIEPVASRLGMVDRRVDEVDAKADRALAGLGNLRLEKKLVLGMNQGATFAFNSAGLSPKAKGEIDRFLNELHERSEGGEATAGHVFVVTGHTDSSGKRDYNYDLGQRRAERVAGYLVSEKGIDPMLVHVVSYGDSKPVSENKTPAGRRENRRIELLVYQEKVSADTATR